MNYITNNNVKTYKSNKAELQVDFNNTILISYSTKVAQNKAGRIILSHGWDKHSITTTKHVTTWLGLGVKAVRDGIKSGLFLVADITV